MSEFDGNILKIKETKLWLREDTDDEVVLDEIKTLIDAAEMYLENATGVKHDSENGLAKLFCKVLVADWYENREFTGANTSEKVRFTIQSMLAQLTYCKED